MQLNLVDVFVFTERTRRFRFLILSILGTLILQGLPKLAAAGTVYISPGTSIQTLVNSNPPGSTFVLRPGIYRMQSIAPKNGDTFTGEPGAILNGSTLVTSFWEETINGVIYWVASGPSKPGFVNGACDPLFPMCKYPEDLFIDNKPMMRISGLSQIAIGKCYFDYGASKIYFLGNPTGHTVETSVTPLAFEQGADNVTIQGLVIEKYATPGQRGTIGDQIGGNGWVIRNNEARLNHSSALKVGNGSQVISNKIHDNGGLGFGTFRTSGVLLQNNEIAHNNWAGFRVTYEAGGAKVGGVKNFTARANYVHDNAGTGLWCDNCQSGVLIDSNYVANNAKNGISHEISTSAIISNNVVTGNGFGISNEWMGGTGIILSESDHVEVSHNFIANNYYGIRLAMAYRKDAPSADLNNNYIHNNIVVMSSGVSGLAQSVGNDAYYISKNNRFVDNEYCIPNRTAQLYWWMDGYRTSGEWKGFGEDVNGMWNCPGVFISSPSSTTVSGTVTVQAAAADISKVTKVEFYVDSALMATGTTNPYSYAWDTTREVNSLHTVHAKAYNSAGQTATTSINVTVKNP